VTGLNAQSTPVVKDTVLTQKQKDRLFLKQAGKDRIEKFKKEFNKTWNKVFIDFTDNNVMLMAGMNFAKQNVRANGYTSPFIYAVEQKNVYKPGFFAGFRVDGNYKEKHPYAVAFTLNKYASGTNYRETKSVEPFDGNFSFENKDFYTLFFHYKQCIHSVTKSPIQTGFNNFDLGMLIKASDLF